MPVHITVVPASTKAGRETIRALLQSENKPTVRGVYRDTSKAPSEFLNHPHFEAVSGDVGAGTGLDFRNSDAVFYIPPPTYDGTDQGEWATRTATNIKHALQDAPGVKRLLLFSAVGAQYDHSIGILRLNHISDKILQDAVPEVTIVRPGYFQEDWTHAIAEAQANPPVLHSWITPTDCKIPMVVSLKDIAKFCANSLLSDPSNPGPSPHIFRLFGPRHYSSADLREAVEKATGRAVELKVIERDQLAAYFSQQLPEVYVQEFVDMTAAGLPGGIMVGDFAYDEGTVRGRVELVDTLRELYQESQKQ
ncbi:NAD(P)H azoreductase [Madurella mycetomatis]|uniref:NAD(P)H azoreductase n=1 Tax=Madurella mycetomatis TaxID=100816 RepID=A0A175VRP0_9PEZI|nr:NAD(P)H azoreductase [Madurella mycetomatis]KXX80420.1 NAD(P)H azoreductase [Madurella mycetomatis]